MLYSNSFLENFNRVCFQAACSYAVGEVAGQFKVNNPKLSAGIFAISSLVGNLSGFLIIGLGKIEKQSLKNRILIITGTICAAIKIVALRRLGFIDSFGTAVLTALHLGWNVGVLRQITKLERTGN